MANPSEMPGATTVSPLTLAAYWQVRPLSVLGSTVDPDSYSTRSRCCSAVRPSPHPVDGEVLKGIFRRVHRLREHRGQRAGEQAGEHATEQGLRPDKCGMRRHGEERS